MKYRLPDDRSIGYIWMVKDIDAKDTISPLKYQGSLFQKQEWVNMSWENGFWLPQIHGTI